MKMPRPDEIVAEICAQAEINERFDGVCHATTEAEHELRRLAMWRATELSRLADEEKQCKAAEAALGERRALPSEGPRENQIAEARARIKRDRAEVGRRANAAENLCVLRLLEVLGFDRTLLPAHCQSADSLADQPGKGAPATTAADRRRCAKIAVALSVMKLHGWWQAEAAELIAGELETMGVALATSWVEQRDRHLSVAEQVIEYAKDFKMGDWKKRAKETRPQADIRPLDERLPRRTSRWVQAPADKPDTGLQRMPSAADLAQGYFDRLAGMAEGHYAHLLGLDEAPREAALWAARFVLRLDDRVIP
jgi:hypothetical protein